MRSCLLVTLAVLLFGSTNRAEDWPFFRGPHRDGKSTDANAPLKWGKEQAIQWKVKLPRPGNSSPIVVGDSVYLTCGQDVKGLGRSLYCFDRKTGQQRWVQTVQYEGLEKMHGTNPHCASSPACDGQRIVVWHGSAGLYCYDTAGKELWKTDLGKFTQIWGYASSPLIVSDRVYLNCGPGVRSFVVCINLTDGKILWQTDEPGGADDKSPETKGWIGSWSTPVLVKVEGKEHLLVFQPRQLKAYDLQTGAVAWFMDGLGVLAYSDVVVNRNADGNSTLGAALSGFGGPAIGFKLTAGMSGNVTESHRLWRSTNKPPQRIGSGVIVGNHLFMPNEPGLILCIDVSTGAEVWNHRVVGQSFWSSIVATPDRLYLTSQKGATVVFAPDPREFKLLATNELAEQSNSTPAISNGQIFLRTGAHLYGIGQ